jgi:hypothetical protein
MARISPVTLTITPATNSAKVVVYVGYTVFGSNHDLAAEQHYREVCELVGDDTPGDGTDDVLKNLLDTTTVFDGSNFTRSISQELDRSILDEDSQSPFQKDEIRAKVTLTPIPTSRESNLVQIGGIGPIES